MRAYIIRRLFLIIPTLFLLSVVVFATVRFIPGDVIELMVLEGGMERLMGVETTLETAIEGVRHALGLDVPIYIQYWRWMGRIFQGDLGASLWTGRAVAQEIIRTLPVTFEIGLMAIGAALVIGLPVGVYSAMRQDTWGDYLVRSFAIACIALPSFWIATLVIVLPSIWWQWSPSMQLIPFTENPVKNLGQFILPSVILGMAFSGTIMRLTRTMMLEVLRQDYVRTAWAKGLTERIIVIRHALKNALIPVVTMVGLQLPFLVGGAIVIEQIFNLPGVGLLLIEALNQRDYPMISGINLFISFFVLLLILATDISYGFLDPRVHYE